MIDDRACYATANRFHANVQDLHVGLHHRLHRLIVAASSAGHASNDNGSVSTPVRSLSAVSRPVSWRFHGSIECSFHTPGSGFGLATCIVHVFAIDSVELRLSSQTPAYVRRKAGGRSRQRTSASAPLLRAASLRLLAVTLVRRHCLEPTCETSKLRGAVLRAASDTVFRVVSSPTPTNLAASPFNHCDVSMRELRRRES